MPLIFVGPRHVKYGLLNTTNTNTNDALIKEVFKKRYFFVLEEFGADLVDLVWAPIPVKRYEITAGYGAASAQSSV